MVRRIWQPNSPNRRLWQSNPSNRCHWHWDIWDSGHHGGAPETGTGYGVGHNKDHHGVSGKLHRSGSSSSSSSYEDDGHGGRRKKGLKEKIKENLPGHHQKDRSHATSTTTPP
ncbi:hypothetical protein GH714_015383 [Hevea brasiliensis]|uniref:Dehydrin n=1 Tax=Hevea brasiliensis TaxID=3981 RepID=A0A6A6KP77_HEVBR|nr:hypothetical protein GH714_015383 [Hevea brasiliensis]